MSNRVAARPRPEFCDVFEFAAAAVEFRYRVLINYLGGDADAKDSSVPEVVRERFFKLYDLTFLINRGRPEDRQVDGHITAARAMVELFGRTWIDDDHSARLRRAQDALQGLSELTPLH